MRALSISLMLITFLAHAAWAIDIPEIKKVEDMQPDAEMEDGAPPPKKGMEAVGKDIQQFGEQVAKRVDRVISKKGFDFLGDPWLFQGLPIIIPSPSVGFNLGLRVQFENIRRQDPHALEIALNLLASDRGRYKHGLQLDIPHALDGRYRIKTTVRYDRDISFLYYGIGNDTPFDPNAGNPDYVLYQNVRAGPSFNFELLRYMGGHVRMGPVLGLKWTEITPPAGSLLAQQQPSGIAGGRTHYLGFAVIYDTLDFEPYPSRGSVHELYVKVHNKFTASNYDFVRATYTYLRFIPLHRRLILAHRTLLESTVGDVPYYELGAVGGSNPAIGFGGDRYMRGFDSNRFIDKIKFSTGFELRWDPIGFVFAKQDLAVGFVPFFDLARVWPRVFPLELGTVHASLGYGIRMIWNSRLIIRGDFAVNSEGTSFGINLGSSF